jgi:gliding motility-associated-like protein
MKDPTHTYIGMGSFDVWLEVSNGTCSEKIKHQVNVVPLAPEADFDSIPSGCEPLRISAVNTSLNTNLQGTTYKWDFGDGAVSYATNPEYLYSDPGSYRIELTVTGPGGTSTKSQVLHVYATPAALFDVTPKEVFVNDQPVRAFNLSQGADYFVWEWGDGDTSRIEEPFHKYMKSGIYPVSLSAFKDNGNGNICFDKYILTPGITVTPAGELRFATVFRPNTSGEITGPPPTGGEAIDQFFFPPISEKISEYKLQIFNRLGVLIFETHDINTPWNGYYKGKLCPQGVYVWFVEGKYTNGQVYKKVGDLTLLH